MRRPILLFILFLLVTTVFAQQKITVSGTVTDNSGMGLPGVSVLEKGTTNGTVTDNNGNYSISATSQSTLVFSFIGFLKQEIPVNSQSSIQVQLAEDVVGLDEVVVVGYGKVVVKDLTSSITTVKSDELVKTPSAAPMQALQGKVAGLQVVSSGAPGNSPEVRVRGVGSFQAAGQAPLYVVDGMFFDNIDFLNMSEVASISVLKDASASAIYGVRAANGVVLIETKSGSVNKKAEIVYDGYYGTQIAQNVLKMANAEQFTTMALESGSAADASFILNAMQRYGRSRINPNVPDVNTDWYNEIMRPAAIQNHSLSVTGGGKGSSYSVGTSYFEQDGILDMNNAYERFNLRSKVDLKANDWFTIGGNLIFSNAIKNNATNAAWDQAYFAVPILPVYDDQNPDAFPTNYSSAQDIGYRGGQNPFPTMDFNDNKQQIMKVLANFYAQVEIIPNKLSFKSSYNHSYTGLNNRNVGLPYYISLGSQREFSTISKSASSFSNKIWDNVLTYNDTFGKHNLSVMAGSSYRQEFFESLYARSEDIPTEKEQYWYINKTNDINTVTAGDNGAKYYGLSYFSRISYNYDSKYLLYATLRADGSNKYEETWAYFPAVGAGWVLSEESFLKNNSTINFLKLRAGWGQLGNDKIPRTDGSAATSLVTTAIDGKLVTGTYTSDNISVLQWEVTEETNVGLTATLFDNHLEVDADYYIRDTKDAAIRVQTPVIGGSVLKSVGVIRNSGMELALNWRNEVSKDLSYNVGVTLSTVKNEVRDLYGQQYIDGGQAEFRQRSIVGEPLLAFYGWEVAGVYQNDAEIQADPVAVDNGLVPGDFKYVDQDGNNIIDGEDRVVLGSYIPTFLYGANMGINYKNWQLSVDVMGQSGNKILNRKRGQLIWTNDGNLDADLAINRWHGEGTSNKYPSSAGLRKGWNQKMSNYFVEDGAFFRIQNVQLAYNIKNKKWFGADMPDARITLTADRPLTVFKYNGFNPEVANGIDTQTYPIPAVYTVGLNVKF